MPIFRLPSFLEPADISFSKDRDWFIFEHATQSNVSIIEANIQAEDYSKAITAKPKSIGAIDVLDRSYDSQTGILTYLSTDRELIQKIITQIAVAPAKFIISDINASSDL